MSKTIEDAKAISDSFNNDTSHITSDLKEIIKSISKSTNGVIMEIPWNAEADGKYMDFITVLAVKATKERLYFINPVKVSLKPCEIKESDKKGIPRRVEKDGLESVLLVDIIKYYRMNKISAVIRDKPS